MKATDKKSNACVSTIWHRIEIGDEIVLINIHRGKVKYRLFDLEFKVMADERYYADDEVPEVVADYLKFLTRSAEATAAWEKERKRESENEEARSEKN